MNSINIGGKTLIDAESMRNYGFDVNWHPSERWLEIVDTQNAEISLQALDGSLLDMTKGQTGRVAGQYYHTDIITTLNTTEIESFNIGGRTFICAEAMRSSGYSVVWNEADRKLSIEGFRIPGLSLVRYYGNFHYDHVRIFPQNGDGTWETLRSFREFIIEHETPVVYGLRLIPTRGSTVPNPHQENPISFEIYRFEDGKGTLPSRMISEEYEEYIVLRDSFNLFGRDVLAEHFDLSMLMDRLDFGLTEINNTIRDLFGGWAAISSNWEYYLLGNWYYHNYYIAVDDTHMLHIIMRSQSLTEDEMVRRQLVNSIQLIRSEDYVRPPLINYDNSYRFYKANLTDEDTWVATIDPRRVFSDWDEGSVMTAPYITWMEQEFSSEDQMLTLTGGVNNDVIVLGRTNIINIIRDNDFDDIREIYVNFSNIDKFIFSSDVEASMYGINDPSLYEVVTDAPT